VLYVAVLLHDIAKGRGGDHSVLGAEVAMELCPRFGLNQDETELVSWLVEQHLLMTRIAFKRDLSDPKTIEDFVGEVQSVERLRQLLILTCVDIRAVGPGTWNSWKGQLLGELYDGAVERLRLGHMRHGRVERVTAQKELVKTVLGKQSHLVDEYGEQFGDAYWIAESDSVIARKVSIIASDHPGLFYRTAGGIHLAGGNIIDARIHTTQTGFAVDNFLVQDPVGQPFREPNQLERLKRGIADALANRIALAPKLAKRPLARQRAGAFKVETRVIFDNKASNRFTVIEVNSRDRPALLNRLARALFESNLVVHSAQISAYGERAADTFYVTDLMGDKIISEDRMGDIRSALIEAASDERQRELEDA